MQRDLNRELKILFDTNGINIPFPQVVVNNPTHSFYKASDCDEEKAREFLAVQSKLFKNSDQSETNK